MSEVFGPNYAAHYDETYRGKDYDQECDLLEEIFRREAPNPVRAVLDLGCGTGSHSVRLAGRGYRVIGVDASRPMLEAARRKAETLAPPGAPRFVEGDVRSFRAERRVDAVLMMFAVLGYQVADPDLRAAIESVRANLDPFGLFVFDVWYGPAVEAIGPSTRATVLRRDGAEELRRVVSGTLERDRRACSVAIELVSESAGQTRRLASEIHQMRYFDRDELAAQLAESGLELLRLTAFPSLDRPPDRSTWNVLGVARATALPT